VPYEGAPGNPIVSGIPSVGLEKNTLKNDEIIFTRFKDAYGDRQIDTMKPRNRIMLELMARGGMRVGEVWIENLYG